MFQLITSSICKMANNYSSFSKTPLNFVKILYFQLKVMEGSPRVVKKEQIIPFPNKVYLFDCHSFLFSPFLLSRHFEGFFPPSVFRRVNDENK